jgi:asparagine synthase (glutamine-hydrolysing)
MNASTWNSLLKMAGRPGVGDKIHKMADRLLTVNNTEDLYLSLVSEWSSPAKLLKKPVSQADSLPAFLTGELPSAAKADPALKMMYWDTGTYLPDDILCKVDRAAMGVSLETRVPLLHQDIVSLAWRLPLHMKKRGKVSKWLLRQVLYDYVPQELIERPKAGFGVPVGKWLRTELRDWAESLLDEKRLEAEGFFHPKPIRTMWLEHLNGVRDWTPKLWTILMFQEWWAAQNRLS